MLFLIPVGAGIVGYIAGSASVKQPGSPGPGEFAPPDVVPQNPTTPDGGPPKSGGHGLVNKAVGEFERQVWQSSYNECKNRGGDDGTCRKFADVATAAHPMVLQAKAGTIIYDKGVKPAVDYVSGKAEDTWNKVKSWF